MGEEIFVAQVFYFDVQTRILNVDFFFAVQTLGFDPRTSKTFSPPVSRASKIYVWASIISVAQNPFPCSDPLCPLLLYFLNF